MPFYHATFRKHLPSIEKYGLGGISVEQNWLCDQGVYLSTQPEICISVMLEHYVLFGDSNSVPRDHLKSIAILVIDDARIDMAKLGDDPSVPRSDVFLYHGVIDVRGMPVLGVDQVLGTDIG